MDFEGLHRILVPVDFSRTSNKAYTYARELARTIGAEIHVVHVLDTHYMTGALRIIIEHRDEMVQKWRERCQERLKRFYVKREDSGFAVNLHMREGKPHEEILKAADELGADIIIIGSHGWSGLERYMFGNIARKVLKISDIPVLVIKPTEKPQTVFHSDRSRKRKNYQNWVVVCGLSVSDFEMRIGEVCRWLVDL